MANNLLPPAAAKDYFDEDIFFLILLRKIRKKMSSSKYNLARSAIKTFLYNPHPKNISLLQAAIY